ncbi:MAG TPA: hypothetical protein VLX59_00160 [Acidimicrobiales bacterium]|nr:hypothetical protein [Acidimicrobiales bacterium]
MTISHRLRTTLAMVVLGILIAPTAGCGLFPKSKEEPPRVSPPPPPPLPVATPAPPPPPPRPSGDRIADEQKLQNLIQGKTTKADVEGLFGIPQEIVFSPGVETFIYYRNKSSGWFSGTTERVEMLTVRFDTKGVLKDYEYRYSGQ